MWLHNSSNSVVDSTRFIALFHIRLNASSLFNFPKCGGSFWLICHWHKRWAYYRKIKSMAFIIAWYWSVNIITCCSSFMKLRNVLNNHSKLSVVSLDRNPIPSIMLRTWWLIPMNQIIFASSVCCVNWDHIDLQRPHNLYWHTSSPWKRNAGFYHHRQSQHPSWKKSSHLPFGCNVEGAYLHLHSQPWTPS